jgi:ParB-like chromosome segregation protein Spo0J
MIDSVGLDLPVMRLRPLRERKVTKREYDRIVASIKAVGLIEPLVVYPEGDDYVILDGVQCYRALVDLGVEVVPCIVGKQREAFTGNRMVNRVSPVQEHRMIEKSLGEVDEAAIAAALGISGLSHRLKKSLLKQLHPEVAAAFDAGKISRACAREFTHVKPPRQKEILQAMEGYKDYSTTFARTLVVKTPPQQRESRGRKSNPWDKTTQKKNDLLKKLADAEQKHDFYSQLYKQYTVDLLRLAIYARTLLTNARLREYLNAHHPEIVARFEAIIADARG